MKKVIEVLNRLLSSISRILDQNRISESDKYLHKLLLKRLYHEDNLLVQRTYALLTAHAFLAVAFVTSVINNNKINIIAITYMFAIVGLLISLFQIALGFRTYRAIRFWRLYLEIVEEKMNLKVDSLIFEFFKKGEVITPVGSKIKCKWIPMNESFPWRFRKSTIFLAGVVLPLMLAIFWGVALGTVNQWQYPSLVVIGIFIIIILSIWIWRPGTIERENNNKNNEIRH